MSIVGALKHTLYNEILPARWSIKTINSIKSKEKYSCIAGPFGSNISSKYFVAEGIPVIRGGNLSLGKTKFIAKGFVFVSEDKAKSFPGQHVIAGDLVFTCWGTLGQVGLIPEDGPYDQYIISNKQLKLRPNPETCDSKYLYYYFSLPQMVQLINNLAIGSAVPGINLGLLKGIKVVLPPKSEQKKIAAILSAYDDLIENNKRRIALLENMAEEIYCEWFVRFRFPGYQTAEFEKGIPKGWELERIDSLGKVVTGKTPSTTNAKYYGGDIPFVKTPDMHGNMFVYQTEEKLTEEGLISQPSQIISKYAICVSCIGTGGVVSMTNKRCTTNQQINSLSLKNVGDLEWAFFCLKGLKNTVLAFGATGATMTNLSKGKFAAIKTIIPPSYLRIEFHNVVHPLFEQIQLLTQVNMNLTNTRDQLLPRLISGKLSVKNLDIKFPPSMQTTVTAT